MRFLLLLAFGLLSLTPLRADIRLEILPGSTLREVKVEVTNDGEKPFVLWDASCSQGWRIFTFRTRYQGQDEMMIRAEDFSTAEPRWQKIEPGKKAVLNFDLQRGTWSWSVYPTFLPSEMDLRVDLRVKETKEAKKHGITIGRWQGVWGKCANPYGQN